MTESDQPGDTPRADLQRRHADAAKPRAWVLTGSRRAVAITAVVNTASTATAAIAGLVIARSLGPEGRGQYAAVVAWFGIALIAGELGQPAALCYFVASDRLRGRDYVATARGLMLTTGVAAAVVGWCIAPHLAHGSHTVADAYRVMFVTCIVSFVGAGYVFALQARQIGSWNLLRAIQPAMYLTLVAAVAVFGRLTLMAAVLCLVISVVVQTLVSYWLCRRVQLHAGDFDRRLARPLLRYGISQVAANAPTTVNSRLDQVLLAGTTSYANLGLYAVAVSVTSLALPVVSAIGSVLFPRIAAGRTVSTRSLERAALRASLIIAAVILAVLALLSPWLMPALFGQAYSGAARLVWTLAAGGVFLAASQVAGDLLRGRGQPLMVALAQGVGAVITVGLLLSLLPVLGIQGAAIASSVAYFATFLVLVLALRRGAPRANPTPIVPGGTELEWT